MSQTHIDYKGANGHLIIDVAGIYSPNLIHKDISGFYRFFEKLKEGTEKASRGQFVPTIFHDFLSNGNIGGNL